MWPDVKGTGLSKLPGSPLRGSFSRGSFFGEPPPLNMSLALWHPARASASTLWRDNDWYLADLTICEIDGAAHANEDVKKLDALEEL